MTKIIFKRKLWQPPAFYFSKKDIIYIDPIIRKNKKVLKYIKKHERIHAKSYLIDQEYYPKYIVDWIEKNMYNTPLKRIGRWIFDKFIYKNRLKRIIQWFYIIVFILMIIKVWFGL